MLYSTHHSTLVVVRGATLVGVAQAEIVPNLVHLSADLLAPAVVVDAEPVVQVGPGDARKGTRRGADEDMVKGDGSAVRRLELGRDGIGHVARVVGGGDGDGGVDGDMSFIVFADMFAFLY